MPRSSSQLALFAMHVIIHLRELQEVFLYRTPEVEPMEMIDEVVDWCREKTFRKKQAKARKCSHRTHYRSKSNGVRPSRKKRESRGQAAFFPAAGSVLMTQTVCGLIARSHGIMFFTFNFYISIVFLSHRGLQSILHESPQYIPPYLHASPAALLRKAHLSKRTSPMAGSKKT